MTEIVLSVNLVMGIGTKVVLNYTSSEVIIMHT